MSETHYLDRVDQTFPEDLDAGQKHAAYMTRWFREGGLDAHFIPARCRPHSGVWRLYSDRGDIEIRNNPRGSRVEVTRNTKEWSSMATFPYPNIVVCNRHKWDEADPKPWFIAVTNHSVTVAAVVIDTTREKWKEADRRSRGRLRKLYECPKELAVFRPIDLRPTFLELYPELA